MISSTVEEAISSFTNLTSRLEALSDAASDEENRINNQTQDILHYVEIVSDIASDKKDYIISSLHNIRKERRIAKQEADVLKEFFKWYTNNKASVNHLTTTLGRIRSIIKDQKDFSFYRFKTNIIEEKNSCLTVGELPGQITFDEMLKDLVAEN